MPKLKPTCPRKTKNSWSPWCQSGGWKGRRTMEEKICEKDEFWAWSEREKELWMVTDQIRVISLHDQQAGEVPKEADSRDRVMHERLLIFREEDEGGRERVTAFEELVLQWGWTEIRLYRYEGCGGENFVRERKNFVVYVLLNFKPV